LRIGFGGSSNNVFKILSKKRGGKKMKTRILISILTFILVVLIITGGCATTSRITEPTNAESTLLVGRIILACTNFPGNWHVNGEHSNGIMVDFRNISTNAVVSVKARGYDGIFYVVDPEAGGYIVEKFTIETSGGRHRVLLRHETNEYTFFKIQRNAVNNLGDIRWFASYESMESKEYARRGGSKGIYRANTSHTYELNFTELKDWFGETYPDSAWNNKNWNNLEFISK
jgi:hypothetical protein